MRLFLTAGIVLFILSAPLALRRVKPNRFYGIRTRATFADEWVWYEANARAGRDMAVLSLVLVFVALALARVSEPAYSLICAGTLGIGALVSSTIAVRRANQLGDSRTDADGIGTIEKTPDK